MGDQPAAFKRNPWDQDTEAVVTKRNPWDPDPVSAEVPDTLIDDILDGAEWAAQKADDGIRATANTLTMGWADALAAGGASATGIGGPPTMEGQQQLSDAAAERSPVATIAGTVVGGGLQAAMLPGAATATMARSIGTGAGLAGLDTASQDYARNGEVDPSRVIVGSILGAIFGGGGYKLGKMVEHPKLPKQVADDVDILRQEGIDVLVGQATRNPEIIKRESSAESYFNFVEKQKMNFSKAVVRKAGINDVDAPDGYVDPSVLAKYMDDVGNTMNQIGARNFLGGSGKALQALKTLPTEARQIVKTYAEGVTGKLPPVLTKTIDTLDKWAKGTQVPGNLYQETRSALQTMARGKSRTDPEMAGVLRKLSGIMDDAMDVSISQRTSGADASLWRAARTQYGNLALLQEAVTSPEVMRAGGLITPQALRAAIVANKSKKALALGLSDFATLSRAGMALLGRTANPASQVGALGSLQRMIGTAAQASMTTGGAHLLGAPPLLAAAAGTIPPAARWLSTQAAMLPLSARSHTASSDYARRMIGLGAGTIPQNPFFDLSRRQEPQR